MLPAIEALAILGSLKRELGDLDRITAWLRVFGMVNAATPSTDTPVHRRQTVFGHWPKPGLRGQDVSIGWQRSRRRRGAADHSRGDTILG